MNEASHKCSETGRSFSSAELARAGESRFREIQAGCDTGLIPELLQGDVIYIGTELYLWHGRDDFRGGLAEVMGIRQDISAGKPTPFVCLAQQPDSWHNWKLLAPSQKKLRAKFGENWTHPDPDYRPEFNED